MDWVTARRYRALFHFLLPTSLKTFAFFQSKPVRARGSSRRAAATASVTRLPATACATSSSTAWLVKVRHALVREGAVAEWSKALLARENKKYTWFALWPR